MDRVVQGSAGNRCYGFQIGVAIDTITAQMVMMVIRIYCKLGKFPLEGLSQGLC